MTQFEAFQTSYPLVPLEELLESYIGGDWGITPASNDAEYVNVKCIRATELKNWTIEKAKTAAPRKIKKASLAKRNLLEGDIILEISGGGPEQPVGRVEVITKEVITSNDGANLVCTNFFRMLRPNAQVIPKFLQLYLDFFYLCGPIHELQSGSNNLRNLRFNDYLKIAVPLPDIEQQGSIIRSIELAYGQIASGIEALCLAEQQLDLYRQSVLKDAFEGKLTADWRAANPDKVEPADKLLARIEAERKAAHQAELDAWEKAVNHWEANGREGKKPSKPKLQTKIYENFETDIYQLKLPTEWSWATLSQLGDVLSGVAVNKSKELLNPVNIPYLRVENVQRGYLNLETIKSMSVEKDSLSAKRLQLGDVLFNEGGDRDKLGRGWVWENQIETCITQNHVFRFRLVIPNINMSKIVSQFGNIFGREYFERGGVQSVNLASLNKTTLSQFQVPIMSQYEAIELIKEIENVEDVFSRLQSEISALRDKSSKLKQSILKQAFSGDDLQEDAS